MVRVWNLPCMNKYIKEIRGAAALASRHTPLTTIFWRKMKWLTQVYTRAKGAAKNFMLCRFGGKFVPSNVGFLVSRAATWLLGACFGLGRLVRRATGNSILVTATSSLPTGRRGEFPISRSRMASNLIIECAEINCVSRCCTRSNALWLKTLCSRMARRQSTLQKHTANVVIRILVKILLRARRRAAKNAEAVGSVISSTCRIILLKGLRCGAQEECGLSYDGAVT